MPLATFLVDHESALRLGLLLGTVLGTALWELAAPLRARTASAGVRWSNHMALAAINIGLARLLSPLAAVGLAAYCGERGIGALNAIEVAFPVAFIGALLVQDLAFYAVHLLFHAAPALWRFHRVHHADPDVDVSTGVRLP